MKIITQTEKQTQSFGHKLALSLRGGEIFLLHGDLGAGKTTLVQGVAKGLKIKQTVNSPTFVLMKTYPCDVNKIKNFIHIDTYRGLSEEDLINIGALEYFKRKDCVSFVEWGATLEDWLKKERLKFHLIEIKNISENEREIEIK